MILAKSLRITVFRYLPQTIPQIKRQIRYNCYLSVSNLSDKTLFSKSYLLFRSIPSFKREFFSICCMIYTVFNKEVTDNSCNFYCQVTIAQRQYNFASYTLYLEMIFIAICLSAIYSLSKRFNRIFYPRINYLISSITNSNTSCAF